MTETVPFDDIEVEIPEYCDLTPEGVEKRKPNVIELMERAEAIDALEDGYRFTLPGDTETFRRVATFVGNERACCSMADFEIACSGPEEPIELAMTGPKELKDDMREGLQLTRFFDEIEAA